MIDLCLGPGLVFKLAVTNKGQLFFRKKLQKYTVIFKPLSLYDSIVTYAFILLNLCPHLQSGSTVNNPANSSHIASTWSTQKNYYI